MAVFTILGEIPNGAPGSETAPPLRSPIPPEKRQEVLLRARDLLLTATGPRDGVASPVSLASLDEAIRAYMPRGHYARTPGQGISAMDYKMYACRAVQRILNAMAGTKLVLGGAYNSHLATNARANALYEALLDTAAEEGVPRFVEVGWGKRLNVVRERKAALSAQQRVAEARSLAEAARAEQAAHTREVERRVREEVDRRVREQMVVQSARLEQERKELARLAAERIEAERREKALQEAERASSARLADARVERDRQDAERWSKERQEAERRGHELQQAALRDRERRETQRRELERRQAALRDREKRETERRDQEQREGARHELEQRETVRRESEQREAARRELERREAALRAREKREAELREHEQREAARRESEQREAARRELEQRERDASSHMAAQFPWAGALSDQGAKKIFLHLAQHGSLSEDEATRFLGSARAFRRFSVEFEIFAGLVPFKVRIEAGTDGKRYVREEER